MAIQLDGELERRLIEAASRRGMDVESFVRSTLVRELEAADPSSDRKNRQEKLRLEMQKAASDPLFIQDNGEVAQDYAFVNAEFAHMIEADSDSRSESSSTQEAWERMRRIREEVANELYPD